MKDGKTNPKITDLIILIFFFLFFQFLTINILSLILSLFQLSHTYKAILYSLLTPPITLILVLYLGFKRNNLSFGSLFFKSKIPIKRLLPLIILSLALNILLSESNNILQSFYPLSVEIVDISNALFSTNTPLIMIISSLSIIITSILEELLFRGIILRKLLKNYSISNGVLLSSLCATFLSFNPQYILSIFTLNLLLGWLYVRSKSLKSCIIANIFYNSWTLISLYLIPYKINGYNTPLTQTAKFQPLWFNLLGVILLALGTFLLKKSLDNIKR